MNKAAILVALDACEVFLSRVEEGERTKTEYRYGTKEGSALRRASMELTRALAEMRKP